MSVVVNLNDVKQVEVDIEKLADDFLSSSDKVSDLLKPFLKPILNSALEFGFAQLNAKLASPPVLTTTVVVKPVHN